MLSSHLVGICGKARSGKDALALMMMDHLRHEGIDARIYHFADPLYAVCRVEHKMVGKDAVMLQHVGMWYREGWRAGDEEAPSTYHPVPTPDVWINATLSQIELDNPDIALLPGTRFPNEARHCPTMIRVHRTQREPSGRDGSHISETAWENIVFNFEVQNNDGMVALEEQAWLCANATVKRWKANGGADWGKLSGLVHKHMHWSKVRS